MRHNASRRKLGRTTGHRLSLFRNQLASLVASERIVTTVAKAKELRPIAERIVTQGKRDTVHARRLVRRWLLNRELVTKLFDEIAPRFSTRPGGYLRITKLGPRQGDGAEMAVLEFVDFKLKSASAPSASEDSRSKKTKSDEVDASGEPVAEAAAKPAKKRTPKTAKGAKPATAKATSARNAKKADTKPKAKPVKSPAVTKKTSAPKKIGGS